MNREFIVRPLARLDVLEAIEWYSERSREIGAEFVRVLDAAFESIRQNPAQFPEVDAQSGRRSFVLFPTRSCSRQMKQRLWCFQSSM